MPSWAIYGNESLRGPVFPAVATGDTTTGLISYWPMDEGSGTNINDTQSNHDATLTLDIWSGGNVEFDAGQIATIPDHADYAVSTALTVFAWIRGPSQSGKQFFAQFDFGLSQRSWAVGTSSAGNTLRVVLADTGDGSGNNKDYEGSVTCFDNTTINSVAFRWNSGTLDLFVNGVKDTSVTKVTDNSFTTVHSSTASLSMGAILNNGVGFNQYLGMMRKARFYNIAKTDADIAAIHALGS